MSSILQKNNQAIVAREHRSTFAERIINKRITMVQVVYREKSNIMNKIYMEIRNKNKLMMARI